MSQLNAFTSSAIDFPPLLNFNNPAILHNDFGQNYIVCGFFTPNYEIRARQLKDSLDSLQINYYLQPVADQGHWEANTRIKPYFLLHCLKKFEDKNVIYLDTDAVVKKSLDYFSELSADISVYITHRAVGMSHDYLTGTLFLANTPATYKLVSDWCMAQNQCKNTMVDQDSFEIAMRSNENLLRIEPLSVGYIKIFDKDYDGEVYIEQYQASREQPKLRRQLIRKRNRAIGLIIMIILVLIAYYSIK